ncbi:MAG: UDP-N-acetylmuramoyl-L-alanyl-D-glutamate--2,6-diaminopimelate ligase [Parcubacteria group bacterium Gr01-1014_33]|nr:MAG: UDP-N-acetylmuramoyl-L-alanyl-D-glutamate--2,6-diaminopimelate ligase [Parcubacteria group bacterium Gr01-1014_33]
MLVIGIVEDKKSKTTAELLHHLLLSLGKNTGTFWGSVVQINRHAALLKSVTVTSELIQRVLALFSRAKTDYAILQLSLEDLRNQVYLAVNFDIIIFTGLPLHNAQPPFSDERKKDIITLFTEEVAASKRKFGMKKTLILDNDMPEHYFLRAKKEYRIIPYAVEGEKSGQKEYIVPDAVSMMAHGATIRIGDYEFRTRLPGQEGIRSALAVLAAFRAMHIPFRDVVPFFDTFKGTAGYMRYISAGQPFDIIIDAPKTSQELSLLLSIARSLQQEKELGLLTCIIGPEKKDDERTQKEKADIAARYCDRLYITGETFAPEDPSVLERFISYLPWEVRDKRSSVLFFRFTNRKEAIKRAVERARDQDILFIPGAFEEETPGMPPPQDERVIISDIVKEVIGSTQGEKAGSHRNAP